MSQPEAPESGERKTRLWIRLVTVYCGVAAFGSFLSMIDTGALWPLTAFDAGLHVLLLPAPFFAGFALWRRLWKLAGGFAFATAFLLWSCASWVSSSPPVAEVGDSESIVVVTWNLGLGTCDPEQVAAELRRLKPHVVLFQEAQEDRASAIFASVSDLFPYREHYPRGSFSKAFLSRIEPVSAELITPPDTKNFLELKIPFDHSVLTITSLHTNKAFACTGRKWPGYERMLRQIKDAATHSTNLVVGDFNLTERNAVYEDIERTGLIDSYRERHSGPGFTFPTFGRYHGVPLPPLLRLDYIWHTPDLRCVTIERTNSGDSDHCGLVARIARE